MSEAHMTPGSLPPAVKLDARHGQRSLALPICEDDLVVQYPLRKHNGELCTTGKREKLHTHVFQRVEQSKLALWRSGAVLIREMIQNMCDACVRAVDADAIGLAVNGIVWTADPTPAGAVLSLNGKVAAEFAVFVEERKKNASDEGDAFLARLVFFNNGCSIVTEAFFAGSYKGASSDEKRPWIAGSHGLGLKDVLSLAFSNKFEAGQWRFDEVIAVCKYPRGICYGGSDGSDDDEAVAAAGTCGADRTRKYFRRFELAASAVSADPAAPAAKRYTMCITDTYACPASTTISVPLSLLLKDSDLQTQNTAFVLTKCFATRSEAEAFVADVKVKARYHPLLRAQSAGVHTIACGPVDNRVHVTLDNGAAGHTLEVALFPGLWLTNSAYPCNACSHVRCARCARPRISVQLSPEAFPTNRDRSAHWEHVKPLVGLALLDVLRDEWMKYGSLLNEAPVVAISPAALPTNLTNCGLQLTAYVVEALLSDMMKTSPLNMSPVTAAIVSCVSDISDGLPVFREVLLNGALAPLKFVTSKFTAATWEALCKLTQLHPVALSELNSIHRFNRVPVLVKLGEYFSPLFEEDGVILTNLSADCLVAVARNSENWSPPASSPAQRELWSRVTTVEPKSGLERHVIRTVMLSEAVPPVLLSATTTSDDMLDSESSRMLQDATGTRYFVFMPSAVVEFARLVVALGKSNPDFVHVLVQDKLAPPAPSPSPVPVASSSGSALLCDGKTDNDGVVDVDETGDEDDTDDDRDEADIHSDAREPPNKRQKNAKAKESCDKTCKQMVDEQIAASKKVIESLQGLIQAEQARIQQLRTRYPATLS